MLAEIVSLLDEGLVEPATFDEAQALLAAGVAPETLCDVPIYAASVVWHARKRFDFDDNGDGERAILLVAHNEFGEPHDLVAFTMAEPDRTATLHGRAFGLGEDNIGNPGTYALDGELKVSRTPLGWLRDGGRGLWIADPKETWRRLADCPRIRAEDLEHGIELEKALRPPWPRVDVRIPAPLKEVA